MLSSVIGSLVSECRSETCNKPTCFVSERQKQKNIHLDVQQIYCVKRSGEGNVFSERKTCNKVGSWKDRSVA